MDAKTPNIFRAKSVKPHDVSSEELTSTEEISVEDDEVQMEATMRRAVKDWLDLHGTKLFALESSKYLAREAKRKNLRQLR